MKDDSVYLNHILDCIIRIEEDLTEGCERFMSSHTIQADILRGVYPERSRRTQNDEEIVRDLGMACTHSQD